MRYLVQINQNPNWACIHLDKRVTDEPEENFVIGDEWQSPYIAKIFEIEGITQVYLKRYEFWVHKSPVFEWPEILPKVLQFLLNTLDPGGQLVLIEDPPKSGQTKQK